MHIDDAYRVCAFLSAVLASLFLLDYIFLLTLLLRITKTAVCKTQNS